MMQSEEKLHVHRITVAKFVKRVTEEVSADKRD